MSTDNQMSGFHTYSVSDESNFSEATRRDLERIIINFTKLPKVQALLALYDRLSDHLTDPTAHEFDISIYQNDLVKQLYRAYRDIGYTGDVGAMLRSIIKEIQVATRQDVEEGYSTVKAIPAVEARYMMQQHAISEKAHSDLVNAFVPDAVVAFEPSIHICEMFNGEDRYLYNEGYGLDKWNDTEGTIYFAFANEYSTEPQDIFSFVCPYEEISVQYRYTNGVPRLVFYNKTTGFIRRELFSLPFAQNGLDRVVISYDRTKVVVKDLLREAKMPREVLDITPVALKLYQPLTKPGTPSGLREWIYYPQATASKNMNFFLN